MAVVTFAMIAFEVDFGAENLQHQIVERRVYCVVVGAEDESVVVVEVAVTELGTVLGR